jgi:hypothetical protein
MKTYSQVYQDQFALKLIGNDGFFVDIGAGFDHTGINSNTLLLEEAGWKGVCIDGDPASATNRRNVSINSDVLTVLIPQTELRDIFNFYEVPNVIDYISLDIDPTSIVGLENFPFDSYEFKIMTFEHDFYAGGNESKTKSYDILSSKGYIRLCDDVKAPNGSLGLWDDTNYFEDWWINPKYFSNEFISNNYFEKCTGLHIIENIKNK